MILLITAICFLIYLSARTVIWLRRLFSLSFLKHKEKTGSGSGETPEEFTDSWTVKGKKMPVAAETTSDTKKEETLENPEEFGRGR